MKPIVTLVALVLALLNAALLVPSLRDFANPLALLSLVLAAVVVALSLSGRRDAQRTVAPTSAPAPAPTPPVIAPPPPPAPRPSAEAEVVAFLGLLQQKGRFVDFLMEDLAAYDDAQIGAAARVVHDGCRQILQEHFQVTPVETAAEGSQVTVPAGTGADEYRVVGKLTGTGPFTGTLVHKGWKTLTVRLPRLATEGGLPAIAPAEVEVK